MSESAGVIIFLIVLFAIWLIIVSVHLFNVTDRIKKLEFRNKKSKPKLDRYGRKKW